MNPDTACMTPGPVGNNNDPRSPQPNQACLTPYLSYLLVSSTSFSSSSPSLSFSPTTQPSSQNTMLCHPALSLHALILSWYRVQHTPSSASTGDFSTSLRSHHYVLTPECSYSFQCSALTSSWRSSCDLVMAVTSHVAGSCARYQSYPIPYLSHLNCLCNVIWIPSRCSIMKMNKGWIMAHHSCCQEMTFDVWKYSRFVWSHSIKIW